MLPHLDGARAEVARAGVIRAARLGELARFHGIALRELLRRAREPRGTLDEAIARVVTQRDASWWIRHADAPLGLLLENASARRPPSSPSSPSSPQSPSSPSHGGVSICLLSRDDTPEVAMAEAALVEVIPPGLRVFRATGRLLPDAAHAQAYVVVGEVPQLTEDFRGKHFHFWRVTGDAATEEGRRRVQAELREQAACLAAFYAGKRH